MYKSGQVTFVSECTLESLSNLSCVLLPSSSSSLSVSSGPAAVAVVVVLWLLLLLSPQLLQEAVVTQLGEKISPLSSAASQNDGIIIIVCGMEGREK